MLPLLMAKLSELRCWARLRGGLAAPVAIFALAVSACGGGGDSIPPPVADIVCNESTCNTLLVGLTDADGDFLSYAVDVVSLTLEQEDGDIVQALPVRQRVDFAGLVDLTELVTAATIRNGIYVGASIRLDYADSEVSVEVNGEPRAATVVGEDGQPLGVVDLDIRLDNRNRVVIAPGRPAFLQLDFDLAASHTVDITTDPATAVSAPFIVASVEPVDEKELRVRGPLVSVNTATSSYVIDLRPFHHPSARLGEVTVHTTIDTSFEIDGVEFVGAAGLAALAGTGVGTPTIAFGVLDVEERTFSAERVLAGDSVPGPRFDVVIGNVIARAGNVLTVRGGTIILRDDRVRFERGDIVVLLGPGTVVTRDFGSFNLLRPGAISVGQRIHAFGDVSATIEGLMLDATQGRVRLNITHLLGSVVSAVPGLLTLDLAAIDGRRPEVFNFSGTGISAASDADPENYEVETGPLSLLGLTPDSPARVFGFVTPFGFAPPDFFGRTVVDFSLIRAELGVGWGTEGTAVPFLSLGDSGLVIDPDNADLGLRHHLKIGPRIVDFTTFASAPTVAPASGRTLFAIGDGVTVEVFAEWAPFVERLAEELAGGARARAMYARGAFDAGSTTLTANTVAVALLN